MGQTDDGTFSVCDEHGMIWTWVYICPYCDAELASMRLVDDMDLYDDDIIGCDECHMDVSVELASLILIDMDGNRA